MERAINSIGESTINVRHFILISIAATFLACAGTSTPEIQTTISSGQEIDLAYADSLWKLRNDPALAKAALLAYNDLASVDTLSIPVWAQLAHAYYYYAQYIVIDPLQRDSLFMKGYSASQTILNRNSSYHELLFSTGDENMAIRGLGPEYMDALYWGMANYGQWLATKGALVRLGQRDVIWTTLEHINDLDPTYYFGAYYRFKGALLSRDPDSQSDTTAIRQAFEKAMLAAPDYLGNNTLMAAYYCPLTGDKDLFYRLLTQVLTAKVNKNLPYFPENSRERILAERLLMKAETEKWFSP